MNKLFFLILFMVNIQTISIYSQSSLKLDKFDCVPDSNMFYYKYLDKISNADKIELFDKIHGMNKIQVKTWISPMFKSNISYLRCELFFKMYAFQKITSEYYSIIVLLNSQNPEFYFVTLNKNGSFINGIPVFFEKNLSNSEAEYDSKRNSYIILSKNICKFKNDTIELYTLEKLSKTNDFINDTETNDELYVSYFLILKDGKLKELEHKKKIPLNYKLIKF